MNKHFAASFASISACMLTMQLTAALAQSTPPAAPVAVAPAPGSPPPGLPDPNPLPLRIVGDGQFELGNIFLNKKDRSISFAALVNMDRGPMEYFLVASHGKVHESILRTETVPQHIHVAMLLMDVKDGNTPLLQAAAGGASSQPQRSSTISDPSTEKLKGDKVRIEVSWSSDSGEKKATAEELVYNMANKKNMDKDPWVYNGSVVAAGFFGAQVSGSIVSLITDREALVNSVAPGHDNDDIWAVNTNTLPKVNTPVRVKFILPKSPEK